MLCHQSNEWIDNEGRGKVRIEMRGNGYYIVYKIARVVVEASLHHLYRAARAILLKGGSEARAIIFKPNNKEWH